MRFSVIIPAYNAEDHITPALESIKAQSFKDYELIVVCDSCTDRTEEIAKSYGARTISIEAHNDGVSRSTGLDAAHGDFILFLDDDDWFLHEFVFAVIDEVIRTVTADIYCFSFIWQHVGYARPNSNNGTLYPSVWNKCWRREFIGDTRFTNKEWACDTEFHRKMFRKSPKAYFWDMPMYYYNFMRPGSQTWKMQRNVLNGR